MPSDRAGDLYERLVAGGENAIDELIQARESEVYFLDFKRSSDQGAGNNLSSNDRNNLAKAISGFGNSEGGVVVWGIDCSDTAGQADVAQAKLPLVDAAAFRARLEGAVSGCTVPAHDQVVSHAMPSHDRQGFVVTHVPKSARAPHQVVPDQRYFMRAGSAFAPVPHAVLQGMFGRRPQPHVFPKYTVAEPVIAENSVFVECGIGLYNDGPGIARDAYVVVTVHSVPGPDCTVSYERSDALNWSGGMAFGIRISLVTNDGFRIAPETFVQPLVHRVDFRPPFERDLKVKILVGCDGSEPYRGEWMNSRERIDEAFCDVLDGRLTGHDASAALLGVPIGSDTAP